MKVGICPCKGCTMETGRSPTCHSTCEKYKHWRDNLDAINIAKRECLEADKDLYDYKRQLYSKILSK